MQKVHIFTKIIHCLWNHELTHSHACMHWWWGFLQTSWPAIGHQVTSLMLMSDQGRRADWDSLLGCLPCAHWFSVSIPSLELLFPGSPCKPYLVRCLYGLETDSAVSRDSDNQDVVSLCLMSDCICKLAFWRHWRWLGLHSWRFPRPDWQMVYD